MKCPKCNYIWTPETRSNPQNRYYWGHVLPTISEHTGHSCEELHEIFKLKFNSVVAHIGKDEIIVGKSTASLKTMEFEHYLSRIITWASMELGVIITNPEDKNE